MLFYGIKNSLCDVNVGSWVTFLPTGLLAAADETEIADIPVFVIVKLHGKVCTM